MEGHRMTKPKWELARQMYLAGKSHKEIAQHFSLSPATVRNRCYKKGWAYTISAETNRKGMEPDLTPDEILARKRAQYVDTVTDMVDEDIAILKCKKTSSIQGIKEKYEAANEMGKLVKDIYEFGEGEKKGDNFFLINGANQFANLQDDPSSALRLLPSLQEVEETPNLPS